MRQKRVARKVAVVRTMNILALYFHLMIAIGIIYIALFAYSLRRQNNPLITVFSLFCLANAVYIFGAAVQLHASSAEQLLFAQKLKYFGLPFISANWLVFAYRIHFKKAMTFTGSILAFCIPVLTVFLVATNEYHHLFYRDLEIFEYKGFLLSRRATGPLYALFIGYAYAVMFFGLYVFFKAWTKSGYTIRNPYFLLFCGRLLSGAVAGSYILGWIPQHLDLLPVSYLIMAIVSAIAIFHYHIFDTKEIYDKKIFSEIKEGLIVLDDKHLLIDYNQAAQNVFTWLTQENKGKPISVFDQGATIIENAQAEFSLANWVDGEERYYEFRATDLMDHDRLTGRIYIFLDITEKQQMLNQLKYVAERDYLTNVYNRRKILAETERLIRLLQENGQALSMLLLDVDHFKAVNDCYGHLAGDEVLRGVSDGCRQVLQDRGMIGRYGGEEFLVVLPDTDSWQAVAIAESMRTHIENKLFICEQHTIRATVSIGVTSAGSYPVEGLSVDDLINRADTALYKAKAAGRNRIAVSSEAINSCGIGQDG